MAEQDRKPKWEVAYHFSSEKNVTISEVLQMRKGGDPRAGDLWCHKACYPNTGTRLSSRNCTNSGRTSHFAKWKGENQFESSCSYVSFSNSRRESINYAQFYHDLKFYFSELEKNQAPFWIGNIDFGNDVSQPDLTITHSPNSGIDWVKTHIVIIDSNTKRKKRFTRNGNFQIGNEYYLVIVISELTPEQLANFQRNGIERIMLSWESLQREYTEKLVRITKQERDGALEREEIKRLQREAKLSEEQLEREAEERRRARIRNEKKILQHPDAQIYVKIVQDRLSKLKNEYSTLVDEVEDIKNCEFYANPENARKRIACSHIKNVDFELRRITEYGPLHHSILEGKELVLRRSNIPIEINLIEISMYLAVQKVANENGFDLSSLIEGEK
tara:strand:- start:256 stop:1419 length:1164 start_codon:yes stop_codon:yes gene_type:complete